jgi:hypothetical protein
VGKLPRPAAQGRPEGRDVTGSDPKIKAALAQKRGQNLAKSHFGLLSPHRKNPGFSAAGTRFIDEYFHTLQDWERDMVRTEVSNAFHTYDLHDAAERRQSPASRASAKRTVGRAAPDSIEMDRAKAVLSETPKRGARVNVPLDSLLVALATTWVREFPAERVAPSRSNSSKDGSGQRFRGQFLDFAAKLLKLEGVDYTSRKALGNRLLKLRERGTL